jgi:hypothetical protein
MKATFEDFINQNPTRKKFENNKDARAIFDILSKKSNILKMMEISEFGQPALSVCVQEIESYVYSQINPTIDLTDDFTRQAIGLMIQTILLPYGYKTVIKRDIPKKYKSKYFSKATCYATNDDPKNFRMIINNDIMEVKKGNKILTNFKLYFTVEFKDDDSYHTKSVLINNKEYPLNIPYGYRSQGNIHLIFLSKEGLWFGLSFDGYEGETVVNSNSIIDYAIKMLNANDRIAGCCSDIDSDTLYNIIKNYTENRE